MNLREIIDTKRVREFRLLFYEITGMFTAMYFPEWKKGQVDILPSGCQLRYCRIIQQARGGLDRCREFDREGAEEARAKRKLVLSTCYAGITGVTIPVFFQDHYLGCIFAGDFLLESPTKAKFARIKKKLSDMELDFAQLESAFFESPIGSKHSIGMAARLLSVMVNYIVDREQVIEMQEHIYQLQKDIGDVMSSRLELEKDMCDKFAEIEKLRKKLVSSLAAEESTSLAEMDDTKLKWIVKKAITFIDKCYSENITLQDVADHVKLSPNYLSALFHQECNCTFIDYLIRKRIGKACDLLMDVSMNISEVSLAVGYEDPCYFNRLFKKLVGIPPGRFRERRAAGSNVP